jgi:hypothetical protein
MEEPESSDATSESALEPPFESSDIPDFSNSASAIASHAEQIDGLYSIQEDSLTIGSDPPPLAEAPEVVDSSIADSVKARIDSIADSFVSDDDDDPDAPLQLNIHHDFNAILRDMAQESESKTFEMTATDQTQSTDGDVPPRPPKRPRKPPEEVVIYTDEELCASYEDFQQDKILPPIRMRDQALDYARRRSVELMVAEDYDGAYRNDLIVNELILACSKDTGADVLESEQDYLKSRLEGVKGRKASAQERYEQQIEDLKEGEEQKLARLREAHQSERELFEKECERPEFVQRFSKPSAHLLQLRKLQKQLALAHAFEEAKGAKAEADRVQARETREAERRAIDHIRAAYAVMLERQQQQIICAKEFGQRKIRRIEEMLAREREAAQNVARQLRIRLNDAKQKKRSSLPPLRPGKVQPPTGTLQSLRNFKTTRNVTMLDVRLTNLSRVFGRGPMSVKAV